MLFMRALLRWPAAVLLCACSGKPAAPGPSPTKPEPQSAPAPAQPAPQAQPQPAPDPDEACGQIIVVAYAGAAHAKADIKRDKATAATRAGDLLQKAQAGSDFAALARVESDAPSSAPRGGIMGTFRKADWPALHAALRDPLFNLQVGQVASAPVEADYGYVLIRRCPVEKAHARHILVRFKGGKHSDAKVTRTREQAKQRAQELLQQLKSGADFAELARTASEDGSSKRGGDIGSQGRGILALPFEQALFALKQGELSDIVETEFGYHIIQRLPDDPGTPSPQP
jgi:parvulin-like peptidyl-prolyl isomerase